MVETVVIPRRFNGPPTSGHGGYSAGVVGVLVGGPAEVTLRRPPPLDTPMAVERVDGRIAVRDGDVLVMEAQPTVVDVGAIPRVTTDEAVAGRKWALEYIAREGHPFSTCFGCGPDREDGEALRLFAGLVPGRDVAAVAWTPDPSFADANGAVRPEILWSAIDCPSGAPIQLVEHDTRPVVVLGRLAVDIHHRVSAGKPHLLVSWLLGVDGRKFHTAVALTTLDGETLAVGRATWVSIALS